MYAMHLASGNSLHFRSIKSDTIKRYVQNVASFLALAGETSIDFRYSQDGDRTMAKPLQAVFDEQKRWENVPNRCEPLTPEMVEEIRNQVSAKLLPTTSLLAALADWFEAGLFNGNRLTEWAQDSATRSVDSPKKNFRGETQAFTLRDVKIQTQSGSQITGSAIASVPLQTITHLWLTWKTQKNQQHGESKMWTRNATGKFCMISAMHRIICRFVALRGEHDLDTPLAIYSHPNGSTQLISSNEIDANLQQLAIAVYNLDPIKDRATIQKFTSHSIRVGACFLLHNAGFSGPAIQFILRWKSTSFMVYLRNSTILSSKQNAAFDRHASMPSLFA